MSNLPFPEIPYEDITDEVKESLIDFKRVTKKTKLQPGTYLRYIKKTNNSKYYGGFFKEYVDKGILQLYTKGRKWMIYEEDCFIFYKNIERNKFRNLLQNFLDNFEIKLK